LDAASEQRMREWPVRELTARHFYAYDNTANGNTQPADEITTWLTAEQNRTWFAKRMPSPSEGGPWSDGSPNTPHGDYQQLIGAIFDGLIE
jgi:hypothetical protein